MSEQQNVIASIIAIKSSLPKKQKILCDFIIESYQSVGMLTVKDLAKAANVGTTTVMRLVDELGYESFIQFRKDIHDAALHSTAFTWLTMEKSFKEGQGSETEPLSHIWQEVNKLLAKTLNSHMIDQFKKSIDLILGSRRVNVLGLRSSKAPAEYFHHLLEEFYPGTGKFMDNSDFVFDRILQFTPGDLLFVISFYPYASRSIEAAQFCSERGHPIILLTDHLSCPIAQYASVVLKTEASELQYSIVPAIALLEAIVIEIGRRTSDVSIKHLNDLGEVLKKKNISYS